MSAQPQAFITPDVVRWARKRRGVSLDELAKELRASRDQISDWESGGSCPPFGKAIDLARCLRIPFGYLFLSEAPAEDIPLPDLRTVSGKAITSPSTDFLDVLNSVLIRQDWYREYAEEAGAGRPAFVGRYRTTDVAEEVAGDMARTLSIDVGLRRHTASWSDYLSQLVSRSESAGVLVMRSGIVGANTRRKLLVKEFRGFVICDPVAPVVFINASDAKAAQTFTLAHELAHIWVGQSGISNPDPQTLPDPQHQNQIEIFCNRVAAELLTPRSEFLGKWPSGPPTHEALQALARHFRVSTIVILRRAYELQRITRKQFFQLIEEDQEATPVRKIGQEAGGNFFNTLPARNSVKLTDTVLGALKKGRLGYREAAQLLGVRVTTLTKLTEARPKG